MESEQINLNKVCRTCKNESQEMKSLYHRDSESGKDNPRLDEMLMACTAVQVNKEDDLPKIICRTCFVQLKSAYCFKEQCEKTDLFLRDYLKNLNGVDIKQEVPSDEDEYEPNVISDNESTPNDTNNDKDRTENIRDSTESQLGHEDVDYVQVFGNLTIYKCRTCCKNFYTTEGLRNHKKVRHHMQLDNEEKLGGFSIQSNEKEDEVEGEGLNMGGDIMELKVEVSDSNDQDKTSNMCKENDEIEEENNIDENTGNKYETKGNADSEYLSKRAPSPKIKRGRGRPRKLPIGNKPSTVRSHERPPRMHECETCNKKFSRIDSLRRHKLSHVNVRPYPCAICKRGFARKDTLNDHMKMHADGAREQPPRTHKCETCNKKFNKLSGLRWHKRSHLNVKPYLCVICKKRFALSDHLATHMELHSRTYNCDICEMVFNREENLVRHKAAKHNIGERVPVKEKKYKCEYCKKGFTTGIYRDTHMQAHFADKKLQCNMCEKSYTSKTHLKEHMKVHDDSSKKFLCTQCGKGFIKNDHLLLHMMRHRGEKPFKCKFCGKGFPRTIDVTVHERYHTGEKPYLCVTCGKGFGRAYNLTVHMRTHTGEKPYRCTHCDAAFAQSNDLKTHVRRHTGERYQCELCPKTFLEGYLLTQHKRVVHGLNIVSNIRRLQQENKLNPDDPPPITVQLPTPVVVESAIASSYINKRK